MSKTSTQAKDKYNKKTYSVISVSLPKELVAQFKQKCIGDNVSQASIVREAVEKFLNE